MPKVVLVNSIVNRTSTGKITEQIGLAARREGWDVIAAYGRECFNSRLETYRIDKRIDIYYHGLLSRIFDAQGLGSKYATKKLISFFDDYKPDIVHLHNLHGYYINYPILFDYLNSNKIKTVWTLHDCWAMTGHCTHFVRTNCDKWKSGCYKCPQKRYYPDSIMFDCSGRNYRLKEKFFGSCDNLHIVGASKWVADMAALSILKKADIRYIHNGIDLDIFHPTCNKVDGKIRVMGIANGWGVSKGMNDFFELRRLLPKEQYEIILVGLQKKHFRNLPDGIRGIERTDTIEDLLDIYSSCDALINLTYADTFPTTNIEALACGTPIITYKTGGSPEAIDNNTGIVVEQGDIVGVINAIKIIEKNGKGFYSKACRTRAEICFDMNKQFYKYVDLYNELM